MKKFYILIFLIFAVNSLYSQDIYKNLVAYYPLNCNSLDSSSNGINGTIFSSPECIEGKQLEALRFDGVDDYINIPKSESNRLISSKGFTWSLWVRSSDIPQSSQPGRSRTFISAASSSDAEDIYIGFGSLSTSRNEIAFVVDGPGGAGASAAANNAILSWKPAASFQADTWYHVVGIRDYDNNKVSLYVDGVLVEEANYPTNNPFVNPLDFSIARFSDGSSDVGSYYKGDLDEIRIYDRVITEQEILILASARPEQIEVESVNIDFTNIQCRADSVIFVNLLNIGPSDFIISETELKNNKEFTLLNGGEIPLADQENYSLGVKFEPNGEGDFSDTLFLRNNFGVQPLILYLSASKYVDIEVSDTLKYLEIVECSPALNGSATFQIINNNIDDGLEISDIQFSDEFSTSDTFSRIELGDTLGIEIVFEPNSFGDKTQTAIVNFTNCNQSRTFTIDAKYTQLIIDRANEFDFGASENAILASKSFTYANIGTTNFVVDSVKFKENTQFQVLNNIDFGVTIENGELARIDLGFTPSGLFASDTMYVYSNSLCGNKIDSIYVFGVGKYRANIDVSLESIDVKLMDKVTFPIKITNIKDLALADIDSLIIEYEVNATSIFIDEEEIEDNAFYKKYSKTIAINKEDVQSIDLFTAEILLGNSSKPEISITNIEAVNGLLNYSYTNGAVNITDICDAGEINRLFMSSFWFRVSNPSPNPANNSFNLNFELIEKGITQINVYNQNGDMVKELINLDLEPGVYNSTFDIKELNQGVYFINLQTPSHNVTKKLIKN